jgi:energy-coupling factor transporter transmembrane protein EcfT
MSNDVYAAMMARGFTGAIRSYTTYRMQTADWVALAGAVALAAVALLAGRYL